MFGFQLENVLDVRDQIVINFCDQLVSHSWLKFYLSLSKRSFDNYKKWYRVFPKKFWNFWRSICIGALHLDLSKILNNSGEIVPLRGLPAVCHFSVAIIEWKMPEKYASWQKYQRWGGRLLNTCIRLRVIFHSAFYGTLLLRTKMKGRCCYLSGKTGLQLNNLLMSIE